MAPRTRRHVIRYGGEPCGTSQGGVQVVPPIMGTHSCTDETHPGPPYNSGGPLLVTKKKCYIQRGPSIYAFYHSALGWYDGFVGARPYIPSPEPTPLNLSGWGAKGYSRTMPLHPIYNLGVSIGELKDFPRMVSQTMNGIRALASRGTTFSGVTSIREFLKRLSSIPKRTGDSYLFGAFGLFPMYQDLLFLLKMKEKLDKKIDWLRRHNGKRYRRRVTLNEDGFSENIARTIAPSSSMYPALSSWLYGPGMNVNKSIPVLKTYQRRIWFVAEYRYFIPELVGDPRVKGPSRFLISDLLGISPDPSLVYKLTPWSWLLDWFTSVGAVLSNVYLRAKYQVIARYAYVMCRETFTYASPGYCDFQHGTYAGGWPSGVVHHSGESRTVYEFRKREEASPYGFGLTYSSFSAYQWSILVALGLSRGGKHSSPRA